MRKAQFTKPLSVAFPAEVYDQIKEISDLDEISMAEWIRQVVDKALEGNKIDSQTKS